MTSLYIKQKSISDFIILLFITSLLVIDFFPYFKSLEIINPQFLYLSTINVLIGVYFYFNSDKIAESTLFIIKKSYVLKIYAVFLFLCGLSYITAKNTSLVFTKLTELFIIFCLFINLSILLKGKLHLLYKIVFIVSITAFLQSWQQLSDFIIVPKNVSISQLLSGIKGNTGNINILAASLTIKVPFLLFGITHFRSFKKWFLLIALFSTITVILLTGARTPYISLTLIFCIYSAYLLKQNSFHKSAFLKIVVIIVPVAIAFLFTSSVFKKSKDNARYVSIENRVKQINTEDASAQARLNFWKNTLKISGTSPLLGIGLGNYQIESIPYEQTTANESNVSLHAHNDFLEILAETGIVNGLIYFSLFVFIFIINVKRIIKSKNDTTKTIACLTLLVLIVYGVDSFFNFPMYRPTMQIFFCLLIAFTIVNNSELNFEDFNAASKSNKKYYLVLIIIGILTTYSAYLINKASNLEYLIAKDDINSNTKGVLNGDEIMNRMPKYPNVLSSSESFYEYAGIYYIREKNFEKALKCFSYASKINPYFGRIEFYKSVIAREKGNIDSAYVYIKEAFYLRPRNIDIYKSSLRFASVKHDTIEILKEHKLFSKYRKIPETWNMAAIELQNAGLNRNSLLKFMDNGLKEFPKDSLLVKQKKDFLITNYIIEGQKFEDLSKLDKALESYQKALKIDPKNIYALQNIGFHYYNTGQNKQAVDYLLKALNYPGLTNGKTEFYLGMCYIKLSDKENACKYFYLAKARNFSNAALLDLYCK